jgi:hypothetical protein
MQSIHGFLNKSPKDFNEVSIHKKIENYNIYYYYYDIVLSSLSSLSFSKLCMN